MAWAYSARLRRWKGRPPGVGGDAGGLVELVLEGLDEGAEVGVVGPARPRRRHHARPQLADHRLGDLGVVRRRRRVEPLQRQVAAQRAVVVTGDAGAAHYAFGGVAARHGLGGTRLGTWCGFCGGGRLSARHRQEDDE